MRGQSVLAIAAIATAAATAQASAMELTSPDFAPNSPLALAQAYSDCGGGNIAPTLSWSGAPAGTKSFAVTVFDSDAPGGWWHWIVYNIAPHVGGLAQGALPAGAKTGVNDFGKSGYSGACPPHGSGVHHYHFVLWALDVARLPVGAAKKGAAIEPVLEAHTLAQAALTAAYER